MLGFWDVTLVEVEPGTEIEMDGKTLVVDDENCVGKGDKIYATATTIAKIRDRIPARHPSTSIGE